MKKFLLLTLALVLFTHIGSAVAQQDFVPLAPIPGLTEEQSVENTDSLPTFFNNLYTYLIGIAAAIAIIQIIRSGIELALNKGSVSEIMSAKGRVAQAIFGLVLILTPALVFGIINPNILNLSVTLTPITFTAQPSVGEIHEQTTATGCSVTWSPNFRFAKGSCATTQAAISFPCPGDERQVFPSFAGRWPFACVQTETVTVFSTDGAWTLVGLGSDYVIPSDRQRASSFNTECRTVGQPTYSDSALWSSASACPSNSGLPPGEYKCQTRTLICNMPQSGN